MPRSLFPIGGLLLVALACASAPSIDTLKVISFGGLTGMPIVVAEAQGIFARHQLKVVAEVTPNSQKLRDGLASGVYDIAHAAADNAIAIVETAGVDVVIVMGGDDSLNELIVQPDITSIEALRGKTVIVDAPNTAYALQLKKVLRMRGLEAGRDYTVEPVGGTPQRRQAMEANPDYAATMLSPPSSLTAKRAGLKSLGSAAPLVGTYQGIAGFVRRAWAAEQRDALVRYVAAYIEGQRWFGAPENRKAATDLLAKTLDLPPDVAEDTYAVAIDPAGGVAADAGLSVDGLRTVLGLRAELEGQWGGVAPPPETYYDLSYREAALARLQR